MTNRVFLSYARVDADFALRLSRDLGSAGVEVWVDQLAIPLGVPWDKAVQEALESCSTVLVILSPEAVSSGQVMDEVSFALDEKRRTVPVLYRSCKLPLRLRRLQRIDFTSDYEVGLTRLKELFSTSPALVERVAAVDQEEAGGTALTHDPAAAAEVGKVYIGKVTRLAEFEAFVEILPGTEGSLHVNELTEGRVEDIHDELKEGEQVLVKVLAINGNRIELSRKALLKEQPKLTRGSSRPVRMRGLSSQSD